MLHLFRQKGLTSVVYGGIVVGLIAVFVLGFNPSAGKKLGALSEACAARVRGNCVEPKAHRAAFRLIFSRGTGGMRQAEASHIVLEGLIERELLVAEAQRFGLTVNDDEITDSIFNGFIRVSLPSDHAQMQRQLGLDDGRVYAGFRDPKTKKFEMATYEKMVKQLTGRSPQEFRDWQSRELLAAKMRDLIRAPVRVADDEAFDRFKAEGSTSAVGYVMIRKGWLEKYAIQRDAKEIGALEQKAKATFDAARAKAQDVLDRVKKGEDIANLAKEFSEDPGSKESGGLYPGEAVERFVEPFKKAVESVKPGELVPALVETEYGWHIIKRDLPADGGLPGVRHVLVSFPDEKPEDVEKTWLEGKSVELSKQVAQKIAADIKAGKTPEEAVNAAIAQYGIYKPPPPKPAAPAPKPEGEGATDGADAGAAPAPVATAVPAEPPPTAATDPERPQFIRSKHFNRAGNPQPIPAIDRGASQAVVDFAFGAKIGDVSEPISSDDGFLVSTLTEQKPATREDFDKDREAFIQQLVFVKKAEALANYTRRLREAAKAEVKIDENNVLGAKPDAGASDHDDDDDDY